MKSKAFPAIALCAAVGLAAGALLWLRLSDHGSDRAARMEKVRGEFAAKRVNGSNWVAPPSKTSPAAAKESDPEGADDGFTAAEWTLVDSIHDALNDEDEGLAIRLAKEAVKSGNPELRGEMVDTLSWFGGKVLPELLMFVDDPDEGVRMDAMAAYQQAIYDIEEESEKAKVIEISLRNLADEEALGELASELIGMDDALAVQTLVNVIEGASGKAGRKVAKETYETVTGEAYVSFEAAEGWLRENQDDE